MYGAYRARASSVNVNYRYVADELHYVLANSGARAIVYHAAFAPKLAAVRGRLPALEHLIQVADGSGEAPLPGAVDYEALLAAESPAPLDLPYSPDDLDILICGGHDGPYCGALYGLRRRVAAPRGLGRARPIRAS
jgi:fatty-acyl-CoA synthase